MLKRLISAAAASLAVTIMAFAFTPAAVYADSDVNTSSTGLKLHGGAGYGSTVFGVILDSDDRGDLGAGPGGAFEFGGMFNYSLLALSFNVTQAQFNKMEFKQNDVTYESHGDGYFRTIDFLAGLKLFTEEGDMGYTHLYGGYKMWKAKRDVDKITLNGVTAPLTPDDYIVEGDGWIAGFRDLSTFPLVLFSLAVQTGAWVEYLPVSSVKRNGSKYDSKEDASAGFGFEFGLGAAFEDAGLSVIGSARMDITASVLNNESTGDEDIAGAGYFQFFLTVTKEISL